MHDAVGVVAFAHVIGHGRVVFVQVAAMACHTTSRSVLEVLDKGQFVPIMEVRIILRA